MISDDHEKGYCSRGQHWVEGLSRRQSFCPDHMPTRSRAQRFMCTVGLHYHEPVERGMFRVGDICEWCGRVSYDGRRGGVIEIIDKVLYVAISWAAIAGIIFIMAGGLG